MGSVLVVEICELEIVVYAAVDEMAQCRDRICDLEDADTGPQFIGFSDREAWSKISVTLFQPGQVLAVAKVQSNQRTVGIDVDTVAVLKSSLNGVKVHE